MFCAERRACTMHGRAHPAVQKGNGVKGSLKMAGAGDSLSLIKEMCFQLCVDLQRQNLESKHSCICACGVCVQTATIHEQRALRRKSARTRLFLPENHCETRRATTALVLPWFFSTIPSPLSLTLVDPSLTHFSRVYCISQLSGSGFCYKF